MKNTNLALLALSLSLLSIQSAQAGRSDGYECDGLLVRGVRSPLPMLILVNDIQLDAEDKVGYARVAVLKNRREIEFNEEVIVRLRKDFNEDVLKITSKDGHSLHMTIPVKGHTANDEFATWESRSVQGSCLLSDLVNIPGNSRD